MDGWVGGWMVEWVGGWVGGWVDGWMGGWVGGRVGGWLAGWLAGWLQGGKLKNPRVDDQQLLQRLPRTLSWSSSERKLKDFYSSCVDDFTKEQLKGKPLISKVRRESLLFRQGRLLLQTNMCGRTCARTCTHVYYVGVCVCA